MITVQLIADNYIITNTDQNLLKSYDITQYDNLFLTKADQNILNQVDINYQGNIITLKNTTNYLGLMNDDAILNLTKFLDYTIINFFLTCKRLTKYYKQFEQILLKSAVLREISLIPRRLIKLNELITDNNGVVHYPDDKYSLDLKTDNRVYSDRNLKIVFANNYKALAVEVNKYGRKINDQVFTLYKKNAKKQLDSKLVCDGKEVKAGISMGPFFDSPKSRYLYYKYDINNEGFDNPEVGMLVIVYYLNFNHEYYVSHFDGYDGTLKLVFTSMAGKYYDPRDALMFSERDGLWVTERGYQISKFGGYL